MPIQTTQTTNLPKKRKPAARSAKPARSTSPRTPKKKTQISDEILFTHAPILGQAPVPPYLWIDHPLENETMFGSHYAVRLGAGGDALQVELSIDEGPWQPCRLTSGYWWYDWENLAEGEHILVARMRTNDGKTYRTPPRPCVFQR